MFETVDSRQLKAKVDGFFSRCETEKKEPTRERLAFTLGCELEELAAFTLNNRGGEDALGRKLNALKLAFRKIRALDAERARARGKPVDLHILKKYEEEAQTSRQKDETEIVLRFGGT